jgi:hypothetical protein
MSSENKYFDLEQWARISPQEFDSEALFNERIRPLLDALLVELKMCRIPAVLSFAYQQDGISTSYETRSNLPSLERTPPGLLLQLYAARNDQHAMDAVLQANAVRVCMTAITRH